MNEILLVTIIVVVIAGTHLLVRKLSFQAKLYAKIGCAVLMLLLIWLTFKGDSLWFRIILTALCVTSIYKEFLSLKKPL